MKLSVIIDGKREFLTKQEYNAKKDQIATIEGIAVIDGGEKFAVQLKDAQSNSLNNLTTAQTLYGDIMPTELQTFGGTAIDPNYAYITAATTVSSGGRYYKCIKGLDGTLTYHDYGLYVRGVVNLNDESVAE